jgi:hypothetical protein
MVALVVEVRHDAFELRFVHLPVGNGDRQLRQEFAQALGALFNRPHLVVHVEHLAAAQGLAQHRLLDERRIVFAHESSDRQAPRRWRGNDRQVAQPAERHVQRTRYRRRGQGQDVDLGAQRLDRVLLAHAKAVLLVDDQEAEVGKSDVALQQLVRADENVDLAGLEATPHVACIRGALEARQHLDAHGPAGEAVAEGVVVLLRQQRGRHQHSDLARVRRGDEGGAHGDFGLAEAHVSADQPIHDTGTAHVALQGGDRRCLVRRLLEGEGRGEALVVFPRVLKLHSQSGLASRVDLEQLRRHVASLLTRLALRLLPLLRAQAVQGACSGSAPE